MANTQPIPPARAAFDAYCGRHAIAPDAALAELVTMALGLPADVQDYLREQATTRAA